jgi:hypothetical protein
MMSNGMIDMLKNVDKEVEEVLNQKHKCEGLYAEIMIYRKKLEALATQYNVELTKYNKLLKK